MKSHAAISISSVLCIAGTVGGCASNTSIFRKYEMASEKQANSVILDAKSRAIVAKRRAESDEDQGVVACAEPSPDVAAAFGAALSGSGGDGKIGVELASAYGDAVARIGKRNATVSILRDAYYRQCEMFLNGAIQNAEYVNAVQDLNDITLTLLAIEQVTSPNAGDAPVTINPPGSTADAGVPAAASGSPAAGAETGGAAEASVNPGTVNVTYNASGPIGEKVAKVAKVVLDMLNSSFRRRTEQDCLRLIRNVQSRGDGTNVPLVGLGNAGVLYCFSILEKEQREYLLGIEPSLRFMPSDAG